MPLQRQDPNNFMYVYLSEFYMLFQVLIFFFYSQKYVRTGQLLPDMKSLLQILTQEGRKLNEEEIHELLIQKKTI